MLLLISATAALEQLIAADEPPADNALTFGWQIQAGAATAGDLPFWIYSNQWGQIDPYSANSTLSLFGRQEHSFDSGITISANANLLLRVSQGSNVHFNQGYLQVSYGYFELWAGRKYEKYGFVHPTLSTGTMDLSENARPVPQIVFATRGFIPVPFTQGVVYADASLGHGWLTDYDDRFVEGTVRIHRKHLYLRIFSENSPLVLHGGLKHFAQWGGTSPLHGNSSVNFRSFIDVFFSRAADSEEIIGGGQLLNSAQNHLGTYDFAALVNTENFAISLSRQFLLEDTPNARFGTPWDGLWGATVSLRPPNTPRSWRGSGASSSQSSAYSGSRLHRASDKNFRPLLETVHYEYLDLKEGMSRFPQRERDMYFNYYNHWAYRGGWTYHNQSLGNSLLLTNRTHLGVVNNEIIAHHAGLNGYIGEIADWRFLTTYSRNYGANRASLRTNTTGRQNLLTERRDQWSFMLELSTVQLFENLETGVMLAYDTGKVHSQNLGAMISVRWTSGLR